MSGTTTPSPADGEGKKSVDFSLNLVPFIDLLSVLISFLLATAVWAQVAKIDVRHEPPGGDPGVTEPTETRRLEVMIKASGYTVRFDGTTTEIAKTDDRYDVKSLSRFVAQIRASHPDNAAVTVTSEDRIPYQALITVMDTCLAHGFDGIRVDGIDA